MSLWSRLQRNPNFVDLLQVDEICLLMQLDKERRNEQKQYFTNQEHKKYNRYNILKVKLYKFMANVGHLPCLNRLHVGHFALM